MISRFTQHGRDIQPGPVQSEPALVEGLGLWGLLEPYSTRKASLSSRAETLPSPRSLAAACLPACAERRAALSLSLREDGEGVVHEA